jgi:hypothetical protein
MRRLADYTVGSVIVVVHLIAMAIAERRQLTERSVSHPPARPN